MENLIGKLISDGVTMVDKGRFETILRNKILLDNVDGDVIECGVWRGGMSIFLSALFEDRKIWVCDSFEGFQPLETAKYQYDEEVHTPSYDDMIKVSLEEVQSNFKKFGFDEPDSRITFLKGWVKDTLKNEDIKKISLLRIDVDSYSATKEILDLLYSKVSVGGLIVFDDSCLIQTVDAFCDFFEENNIEFQLRHPNNDSIITDLRKDPNHRNQGYLPCGCYIIKNNL
jgi:hypothetical protein